MFHCNDNARNSVENINRCSNLESGWELVKYYLNEITVWFILQFLDNCRQVW